MKSWQQTPPYRYQFHWSVRRKRKNNVFSWNRVDHDESKDLSRCLRVEYKYIQHKTPYYAARDLLFVGRWGVKIRTRMADVWNAQTAIVCYYQTRVKIYNNVMRTDHIARTRRVRGIRTFKTAHTLILAFLG